MFFTSIMCLLTFLLPIAPDQQPAIDIPDDIPDDEFAFIYEHLRVVGYDPFRGLLTRGRVDDRVEVYPSREAYLEELARLSPEEQRQYLGDRLYDEINELKHENVAKVTEMILELPQSEILDLLLSRKALKDKVDEAVDVLREHRENIKNSTVQDDSASSSENPAS